MKSITLLLAGLAAAAAATASVPAPHMEPNVMHAAGTFDVKVTPQTPDNAEAKAAGLARLSLSKSFHGALEATGQGEMLASGDGTRSGAYVAIEKVAGTLQGRNGSFVLVHRAVMNQGVPQDWTVAVVPDSGTEALQGLNGAMRITITDGKHYYDFDYTLPPQP